MCIKLNLKVSAIDVKDINMCSSRSLDSITAHQDIAILCKYSDFVNVFLEKSAAELPNWTKIKEHAIELKVIR